MDIIVWIVLGLVAGLIAGAIMGGGYGLIGEIVLGIVGALVGGFIGRTVFGTDVTGFNLPSLLLAVLGACIVIAVVRALRGSTVRV